MIKTISPWFAVVVLLVVGCDGGSGSASGKSAAAVCEGTYSCSLGADTGARMDMKRDSDGVCHAGSFEVQEDGTIESDGTTFELEGTTASFTICLENETNKDRCIRCVDPDAPATGGPGKSSSKTSTKECTGSPTSCSSGYPGHCSVIRGCMMRSHIRYDGSLESQCEGSPDSCSEMTSESSCESQGCSWK